jgi:hypothetical protein
VDYVLLNHSLTESNGQPSKTPITVFDVESNSGSIMHLVEQCREAIGADCNLTCPAEFIPSGVSCSIGRDDGSETVATCMAGRFDSARGYFESTMNLLEFAVIIRLACVKR